MFEIPDLTVTRIDRNDAATMRELQSLLERCSDYYELVEGEAARPSAATDEFDLPPEVSRDDIFILGFREGDDLIAEMSLLRNYPKPMEWWMALFVVQAESRSRGIGTRICEATFSWIASIGGTAMVMFVDEENPRGQKFWQSLGLIETGRRDHTSQTGVHRRVITMRRTLTPTR
jgi:ribosomal protein S18 acetylase RimI-like enzyme